MKTLVPSLFFSGAYALYGNLTDVFRTVNAHNKEMVFLKSSKSHEDYPSLLQMHVNAELLHEYGCWCYQGRSSFGKGQGQPVDAFDEICRHFNQAYECVMRDAAANGEAECDPFARSQQGYSWDVEYQVSNMKVDTILTCTGDSGNWCENTVCEIDMMYTKLYLDLIMDAEEPAWDQFGHEQSGFKASQECGSKSGGSGDGGDGPVVPPTPQPYKKCCGMYPHRWIYRTDAAGDDGSRACCDLEGRGNLGQSRSRTYMTNTHVCCGEQGVQHGDTCL